MKSFVASSTHRLAIAYLTAAALLGACASTGSGLVVDRSAQRSDATPVTQVEPPTSTTPAATDPGEAPSTIPAETPASGQPAPSVPGSPAPGTGDPNAGDPGAGGVSGVGDILFPDLGNPGIDVEHYDIDLAFDHATAVITATATLTIVADQPLSTFTLDAVGLKVSSVDVDDVPATFAVDDPELRITPAQPLTDGETFAVAVTYSAVGNRGTISAGVSAGWFETANGSFVLNEPDGARNWLPSNDHPSDKATYHFTIRLPKGVTGVANGSLVSHVTAADGDVWVWDQPEPMTTYLIQLMTGPLQIVDGKAPNGVPMTSVLQQGDQALMQPFLDATGQQIDFFDDLFGPYPFDSYGIAMTDGFIGGAMEEQGRSLYSRGDFASGRLDAQTQLLLSHELTHQWFGDAVSPARWTDIWLNESFATYGQWLWLEHAGYGTVDDAAAAALRQRQGGFGSIPTGSPTVASLFGYDVYEGGAVVLQALRKTVGDTAFFEILRSWVQDNLDTSRTSADFIALSSRVAGRDLTAFFDTWLYSAQLPASFPS